MIKLHLERYIGLVQIGLDKIVCHDRIREQREWAQLRPGGLTEVLPQGDVYGMLMGLDTFA